MKFEKISYTQFKKDNIDTMCGYEQIKLPQRATKSSAGYDIYSVKSFELKPRQSILLPTGIKMCIDSDKFYLFYLVVDKVSNTKYNFGTLQELLTRTTITTKATKVIFG